MSGALLPGGDEASFAVLSQSPWEVGRRVSQKSLKVSGVHCWLTWTCYCRSYVLWSAVRVAVVPNVCVVDILALREWLGIMVSVTVLPGVVRCDVAAGAGMWCPSVLPGAAPLPPHRPCSTVPNTPHGAPSAGCCCIPNCDSVTARSFLGRRGAGSSAATPGGFGAEMSAWHPAPHAPLC